MTNPKRRTLPAVVAGALGIGAFAAFAGAAPTDLQQQVNELQAKVQAMEAQKAPQTAQINATIASVLADAEQHSKLLANVAGPGAGHDDQGFYVRGDGFEIRPGVVLDFRYALDYRKDSKHAGTNNSTEDGFEVNRIRLTLAGFAVDENLTYFFQWDGGDINGGTGLLDATVWYRLKDTNISIFGGQFKDPFSQEANVKEQNQLCVDRSLTQQLIGNPDGVGSRIQGLGLMLGGDDAIHAQVMYHDGFGSANTSFVNGGVNWGVAARVDFKAMGKWADYGDLSARNTAENLLVIGAGGDITQGDNFTAYHFTVDAQYEMPKTLALYGGFLGLYTDNRNAAGTKNTFDWGFVVQAGYAIDQTWEPFARFDWTHFDQTQANGKKNTYEITAGINAYLNRAAKVSVDVTWLPKGTSGGAPYQDILGGTSKTELLVRGQFQLVIYFEHPLPWRATAPATAVLKFGT